MRIRPVGAHALLLDCAVPTPAAPSATSTPDCGGASDPDPAGRVEAWRAELWRRREAGELDAVEIVPAATTVLLDGVPDPAATAARIAGWTPRPATPGRPASTGPATPGRPATADRPERTDGPARTVEVPVRYDGADLPTVAEHWGVTGPEVVRRLTATPFRVAFCGFAPGFGYLTGLPERWAVPRLATPRPRVPAGSVALAGPYAGIYPTASPGGWLLVGRTDLPLFDVHADPPATLTPGTRVRLVPA